jgi:hypothetical protein
MTMQALLISSSHSIERPPPRKVALMSRVGPLSLRVLRSLIQCPGWLLKAVALAATFGSL